MDLVIFLPLLIVMGAFMYFASRRQKKAMQATIDLHNSLQIGDEVHTTSGLRATITGITDDYVDLEIAPGVVTTWMKLAVRDRITEDVEDDEDTTVDEDTRVDGPADGLEPRATGSEVTDRPNTKTDG
ncbi:preprotein translocase subunit YajC [Mycobacterium sp. smrl_JER01]|uniref:preprotein translocase subunit YajC n=1 Tax=Mycobacterium sp. smrl_JER01 TaxID=3402633 RepID=UPI003AC1547C